MEHDPDCLFCQQRAKIEHLESHARQLEPWLLTPHEPVHNPNDEDLAYSVADELRDEGLTGFDFEYHYSRELKRRGIPDPNKAPIE